MCLGKLLPGQLLRGVSPGPRGAGCLPHFGEPAGMPEGGGDTSTPVSTQRLPGICSGLGRWQAGGRAVGGRGGQLWLMLFLSKCPGTTERRREEAGHLRCFSLSEFILVGFQNRK